MESQMIDKPIRYFGGFGLLPARLLQNSNGASGLMKLRFVAQQEHFEVYGWRKSVGKWQQIGICNLAAKEAIKSGRIELINMAGYDARLEDQCESLQSAHSNPK